KASKGNDTWPIHRKSPTSDPTTRSRRRDRRTCRPVPEILLRTLLHLSLGRLSPLLPSRPNLLYGVDAGASRGWDCRGGLLAASMKDSSMRIAQVSPLYASVPPKGYGGTERIVSYITEELVNQGHDVTLYASGDSKTKARLISPCPRSFRADQNTSDSVVFTLLMLEQLFRDIDRYDIVHFHIDSL